MQNVLILGDSGAIFAAAHDTNPFGTLPITLGMVETTAPGIGATTITTRLDQALRAHWLLGINVTGMYSWQVISAKNLQTAQMLDLIGFTSPGMRWATLGARRS